MRHGILGPGGIGGLIGAVLAHAGENVTLIVRPGTAREYPPELYLESASGNIHAPVTVSEKADQHFDVLWISVKATELQVALSSGSPETQVEAVVPLLNGIDHVEMLRNRFGNGKVVPATIFVESERVAPGRIVHRSPFVRLNLASIGRTRLSSAVEEFQRFGFECKFIDDEQTLLWSKLVFLAPAALSTTAGRCAIGDVVGNPERFRALEQSVREACAVATAEGAKLDPEAVLGIIKGLPPGIRSSMEKDVSSGKAPELDAIAGPILRGGKKHGIATPATSELAKAIAHT